jgi:endonuclease/exonuclease/phosphatase family metal-dependent hydrolase
LSHIDHIFVNKQAFVNSLQVVDIPGSDHKWFLFDLQ